MSEKRCRVEFIKPLHRLAVVLSVAPPYSFKITKTASHDNCNDGYAVLVVIFLVIGYVLSTIGRVCDCYPLFAASTLIVTDAVFNFALTIANLLSVLMPTYCMRHSTYMMFHGFNEIDACFPKNTVPTDKTRKTLIVELFVGHLIMFSLFAYDAYVWITKLGFRQFRSYIFRDVQNYYSYVTVMIMYNIIISLKCRIQLLNNMLQKISLFPRRGDNVTIIGPMPVKISDYYPEYEVRQLSKLYESLIDEISLFNKIFGWQILFTMATIVIGLLNTLDVLLTYAVFGKSHGGVVFGLDIIILTMFWSLLQLVLGTIVAASCDAATKEAQRTTDICYKLLLNLPPVTEKVQDRALRQQLHLLAQLSSQSCPSFSAAGFFKVDYSTLLSLFGSVTSYVIVVIQFNK